METCKVWAEAWQNTQIHIFCDNMAVVEVLHLLIHFYDFKFHVSPLWRDINIMLPLTLG